MKEDAMRYDQALIIAKYLGRLKDRVKDEDTRRMCISEVEDAIRAKSTILDDYNHLKEFRKLTKYEK